MTSLHGVFDRNRVILAERRECEYLLRIAFLIKKLTECINCISKYLYNRN